MNTLLKAYRIENGFKQADMALKLGVSQPEYSAIENGKREPSKRVVELLAEIGIKEQEYTSEEEIIMKFNSLDREDRAFIDIMLDRLLM